MSVESHRVLRRRQPRGAHGADGVVFGDARQPEGGHDAVPEQLDDAAAVRLDDGVQRPVVALRQGAGG
jgi:hypothetical protein